ncbi:MAG: septum site-determining protein MinD, partial [Fusobacteriaceae bacterium]
LEANEIRNPKLIINRLRVQMVKDGNMLSVDDVIDILGIKPIGIVPDDENIVISTNKGEPLVYKGDSLAAKAYNNIAARTLGRDVEFLDLDPKVGFFDKIKEIFRK